MNILLSNDDGILANGIRALIEALSPLYNVYVVAPDRERSAAGHSLTLHTPLRVEEVDAKLKDIMVNICHNMDDAARRYGMEGNYVAGANIAGFEKVADAMTAQGIV